MPGPHCVSEAERSHNGFRKLRKTSRPRSCSQTRNRVLALIVRQDLGASPHEIEL